MARPRHRSLTVTRDIAENLVIDVLADGGPVDVTAVRTLIALLARAPSWIPDTDDEHFDLEHDRRFYVPGTHVYPPLYMAVRPLREDLGRIGLANLKRAIPGVAALRVGLRDEPRYGLVSPILALMQSADGGRLYPDTVAGAVQMERTLMAAATGHVQGIRMDTRVLRRLRCRYSPVLYLRALACLQRPPAGAKAGRNGKLWFDVPYGDARPFLGVSGFAKRGNLTQNVMGPAMRELAEVGVDLSLSWKENYRGEPTALRVGIASTEATRRAALTALARKRDATLAARRVTRRERRLALHLESVREAGGSVRMARLRYLSRRRGA
jgi:hypothetical protein